MRTTRAATGRTAPAKAFAADSVGRPADPRSTDLNLYSQAWLCGGPRRVALALLTALFEGRLLVARPHPDLDDIFLEVPVPTHALRGLEGLARDLLWQTWGARGARLDEAVHTLAGLWGCVHPHLVDLGLARSSVCGAAVRAIPALVALLPALLAPSVLSFAVSAPMAVALGLARGELTAAGCSAAARFRWHELTGGLPTGTSLAVQAVAARGVAALPSDLGICTVARRNVGAAPGRPSSTPQPTRIAAEDSLARGAVSELDLGRSIRFA